MFTDDPLPLDVSTMLGDAVAAEVIITPAETPFLKAAAARGCVIHPGRAMLVARIDPMLEFMLGERFGN